MRAITGITRKRLVAWLAGIAAAAIAVGVLISFSSTDITRARLERSLPATFSNVYVQQAAILGHEGVTVASLDAKTTCDKGGPHVADEGAGADWICLMTWHDPNIDETLLPGKFEVNVHTNSCYTAGGPSKIVGLLTITDTRGRDVTNPAFEFDGCFDPASSNRPTGTDIPPATSSPSSAPAALTLAVRGAHTDARGVLRVPLACSNGAGGCGGTLRAEAGGRALSPFTYVVAPGKTGVAVFRLTPAARGVRVTVTAAPVIGTAPAVGTVVATPAP